jgi:hypothetical protein
MTDKTVTTKRPVPVDMVMSLFLAELKAEGKPIENLSPDDIKARVDRAIADLRFAADVVEKANARN